MNNMTRRPGRRPVRTIVGLAMGILAVPYAALAQQPPAADGPPPPGLRLGGGPDPVARVIRNADALELSEEQLTDLEAIQEGFLDATAEAREVLEARREELRDGPGVPAPRERLRMRRGDRADLPPELRDAFATIRTARRVAMEEVRASLDDVQILALRALIRSERPRGARADRPGRGLRGGGPGGPAPGGGPPPR